MIRQLMTIVLVAMTAGCSSLSGLDASDSFVCPKQGGVLCENMTSIYERSKAGTLPAQVQSDKKPNPSTTPTSTPSKTSDSATGSSVVLSKPLYSGTPIRSAPKVLRVWIAPWEDTDGDLHDQSYVYLTIDQGRWLIDHNRRRIADAFGPIRPPAQRSASSARPDANTVSAMKGAGPQSSASQMEAARQVLTPDLMKSLSGQEQ
jgi:conjugal transfer pilus assembly protein TraV